MCASSRRRPALRLTTDAPISYIAEESPFVAARPINLILGPDEGFSASIADTARDFRERTADYWNEWVRYLSVPFEWQDAVIRAAITLKLCSFEETGAIVAALTTSIPEAPDSGRNWDYRYCWLRDAYFVVHALNRLGATLTMERLHPLHHQRGGLRDRRAPEAGLRRRAQQVAAGMDGRQSRRLSRHGAGAGRQSRRAAGAERRLRQHHPRRRADVLRSAAAGAAATSRSSSAWSGWANAPPCRRSSPMRAHGNIAAGATVHTFSSVMCWVACDRLAKIARRARHRGPRRRTGAATANDLRTTILERAFDTAQNSFVSTLGGSDLDASLLLLQEVGFVSATDPRFLGTVAAVERVLRRGNHLLRYVAPTISACRTTSFTVCTFWYIDALVAIGRRDEARELFEHVLRCRNHVGLLSEDIDPATGELWGNFPQTYSLVGLDRVGDAAQQELGGGILARLVIVSNRIALPRERGGARRRPGRRHARRLAAQRRAVVRLERRDSAMRRRVRRRS